MTEKPIRNATRILIINQLNEVLVIKYPNNAKLIPGFYDLPGGKIEAGESSRDCIIRETLEETGISIADPIFIGYVKLENDTTIFNFTIFVKAINKMPLPKIKTNDTEWTTGESIQDKNITPVLDIKDLMRDTLRQNRHFRAEIVSTGPQESIVTMKYETF